MRRSFFWIWSPHLFLPEIRDCGSKKLFPYFSEVIPFFFPCIVMHNKPGRKKAYCVFFSLSLLSWKSESLCTNISKKCAFTLSLRPTWDSLLQFLAERRQSARLDFRRDFSYAIVRPGFLTYNFEEHKKIATICHKHSTWERQKKGYSDWQQLHRKKTMRIFLPSMSLH